MKLPNYVNGQWSEGAGPGEPLIDPVTGDELASISSQGVNLEGALQFARAHGGPALRQLTYAQRAELLSKISDVLAANRDEYFRLSLLNLGATQADASFDVDGAIYTMKYYSKIGRALADGKMLKEGALVPLSKSNAFVGQHFLMPTKGAAVFINAFNFPAWGLCEKAAPALLSGVPIGVPHAGEARFSHGLADAPDGGRYCKGGYLAARSDFHHLRLRSRPTRPRSRRGHRFLYRLSGHGRAYSFPCECPAPFRPRKH